MIEGQVIEHRALSEDERRLLRWVVERSSVPGVARLAHQIDSARVVGGIPTLLELAVEVDAIRVDVRDGPLPVRVLVESRPGMPDGELLVWTKDGYLSALELAWYTEEVPRTLPTVDQLRLA